MGLPLFCCSILWIEGAKILRVNILRLYVPLRSQSESPFPSDRTDQSESNSELIRLGDTAHVFFKREEGEFGWKKNLRHV